MDTKEMPDSVTVTPAQYRKFANNLIRDFEMQLKSCCVQHTVAYAQLLSVSLTNATCSIKALAPFFPAAFAIEERWSDLTHAT